MTENRADELEKFKTYINLPEYAASFGYKLDKAKSSRNSYVMRNDADDKIVIMTAPDGHGVYFSMRDDSDNGSIIDFHQKRTGDNLGITRQALRKAMGVPSEIKRMANKPRASDHNIEGVIRSAMKMGDAIEHPYLMSRGISKKTLSDDRFRDVIRTDQRGNAVFLHYDQNGLSGYELKNQNFTGFSRGGKKSVWRTPNLENAKNIVLVESAIDAMSHAQITKSPDTAYISTGGALSKEQRSLLIEQLKRAEKRGQGITLAFDNDNAGKALSMDIQTDIASAKVTMPKAKDWNDQLQRKRAATKEQGSGLSL